MTYKKMFWSKNSEPEHFPKPMEMKEIAELLNSMHGLLENPWNAQKVCRWCENEYVYDHAPDCQWVKMMEPK